MEAALLLALVRWVAVLNTPVEVIEEAYKPLNLEGYPATITRLHKSSLVGVDVPD